MTNKAEVEITAFIVDIVNVIREKLEPILGENVVKAIMLSVKRDLRGKFSFLDEIEVEDKVELEKSLKIIAGKIKLEELREAFKEFISQLFVALVKLTGDILIKDIQKSVGEKLSKLKETGGSLKT